MFWDSKLSHRLRYLKAEQQRQHRLGLWHGASAAGAAAGSGILPSCNPTPIPQCRGKARQPRRVGASGIRPQLLSCLDKHQQACRLATLPAFPRCYASHSS